MIEPVENRSMLVKLKPCTFSNSSWRRFLAKPAPAIAANLPARKPAVSEHSEHSSRIRPNLMMAGMLPPLMPSSMSEAITVGMRISRMPSMTTASGVRMLTFLYSRSDLPSVRSICRLGRLACAACWGCAAACVVAVTIVPFLFPLLVIRLFLRRVTPGWNTGFRFRLPRFGSDSSASRRACA